MQTVLVAAAALIDPDGRVLLGERPAGKMMSGMWEFPGGKVEAGELPDAALLRELKEELGIILPAGHLLPLSFVSHRYLKAEMAENTPAIRYEPAQQCSYHRELEKEFHLLMLLYAARRWEGIPEGCEGQRLQWKRPQEMAALPMPPADKPLIAVLRDYLAT